MKDQALTLIALAQSKLKQFTDIYNDLIDISLSIDDFDLQLSLYEIAFDIQSLNDKILRSAEIITK